MADDTAIANGNAENEREMTVEELQGIKRSLEDLQKQFMEFSKNCIAQLASVSLHQTESNSRIQELDECQKTMFAVLERLNRCQSIAKKTAGTQTDPKQFCAKLGKVAVVKPQSSPTGSQAHVGSGQSTPSPRRVTSVTEMHFGSAPQQNTSGSSNFADGGSRNLSMNFSSTLPEGLAYSTASEESLTLPISSNQGRLNPESLHLPLASNQFESIRSSEPAPIFDLSPDDPLGFMSSSRPVPRTVQRYSSDQNPGASMPNDSYQEEYDR